VSQKIWAWVLFVLAVKIYFIFAVPLTGDEAYFIRWAHHLDFGYYDHPPMIGWLLYVLGFFSERIEWFRFFSLLTSAGITWLLYTTLKPVDQTKAGLVALLFWSSPVNLLMVPVTNDTALTFFGLFSVATFITAVLKDSVRYALVSGAFLGLAFLGKYFAVVLFLGMVVYLVVVKGRAGYRLLLAVIVGGLPFGVVNLYWNMCNCWDNIMFNVYNRHGGEHGGLEQLLIYLLVVLYFLMPWNLYIYRKAKRSSETLFSIYRVLFVTAFLFYALLSLRSEVGAHWLMLFIPLGMALFASVDEMRLKKMVKYTAVFTIVHMIAIGAVLNLPLERWAKTSSYKGVVLFDQTRALCDVLEPYRKRGDAVVAYGYTESAILSYHCGYEIPTLFNASKYGRLDDKALDVRVLQGRDIVVFHGNRVDPDELKEYGRYFHKVSLHKLDALGAQFNLVRGESFDYETYRTVFLRKIKEKFYTIPEYLPMRACYFLDRYFKDETPRP